MLFALGKFNDLSFLMNRLLFLVFFYLFSSRHAAAQDTLTFKGQPNWKQSLDIADSSLFFEETSDRPLTFEQSLSKKSSAMRNSLRVRLLYSGIGLPFAIPR
jgi:hypothetical protein